MVPDQVVLLDQQKPAAFRRIMRHGGPDQGRPAEVQPRAPRIVPVPQRLPGVGLESALVGGNTFTLPIDETVDCMPSGSTDLDGTVTFAFDDVAGEMSLEADVSARPEACAHVLENGDIIKITGDPDLAMHLAMVGYPGVDLTSLSVTEKGAFKWTRGGASGRCAVDLASVLNAATQMVTVTGTFCGFPVSETFPVEA